VSVLGASISPYLYLFYSSGAIEDHWKEDYIGVNRVIATTGMSFGSLISVAVLILGALVFPPRGLHVDHYSQLALLLQDAFGHWGFVLVVSSLGIACLGAALEISLQMAYFAAQGFGWNWSENQKPKKEARFSLTYTVAILLGALIVLTGLDPLKLTVMSMVLTAATLPLSVVPFLILMNDRTYLEGHCNGWFSNSVVILIILLAFVLAIVSIPLQIAGGS
jgi:Mn2+/Fe2+ NRAMP family transporter